MSDNPWAPVAHEAIDEPPAKPARPKHEPETRDAGKKEPRDGQQGMALPIPTLSLTIPPELIATISMLVASQSALVMKIDGMEKAFSGLTEKMETALSALSTGGEDASAHRSEMMEQMQGHADGQAASHGELVASVAALSENLKGWTDAVRNAITAPRQVTLQRDKDGNAVGAVSVTDKQEA